MSHMIVKEVRKQAEDWANEKFGPSDRWIEFSKSDLVTAFMAGFSSGLQYSRERIEDVTNDRN